MQRHAGAFADAVEPLPGRLRAREGLPDRPAARPLARLQAQTQDTVTTLRHQNLRLNRTARQVARMLDGTRTRPEIVRLIEQTIREGARAVGGEVELTDADREQLARNLEKDLQRFVAEALLTIDVPTP